MSNILAVGILAAIPFHFEGILPALDALLTVILVATACLAGWKAHTGGMREAARTFGVVLIVLMIVWVATNRAVLDGPIRDLITSVTQGG